MSIERTEIGRGAWIFHDRAWLSQERADELLALLLATEPWEQRELVVFGKPVLQPRLMSWAGDLPYRYSGQTLPPRALPPALAELQARLNDELEQVFNHVVLNRYRDGRDHVGMHADDERELGRDPVIASVSLGATRRFSLKGKHHGYRKGFRLRHGSLLVMGGSLQHSFRHSVPQQVDVKDERLNLTFRHLLGAPGTVKREPAGRSSGGSRASKVAVVDEGST